MNVSIVVDNEMLLHVRQHLDRLGGSTPVRVSGSAGQKRSPRSRYVDPTATVLRVQLNSDAPLESELLTLAIKAEVLRGRGRDSVTRGSYGSLRTSAVEFGGVAQSSPRCVDIDDSTSWSVEQPF